MMNKEEITTYNIVRHKSQYIVSAPSTEHLKINSTLLSVLGKRVFERRWNVEEEGVIQEMSPPPVGENEMGEWVL